MVLLTYFAFLYGGKAYGGSQVTREDTHTCIHIAIQNPLTDDYHFRVFVETASHGNRNTLFLNEYFNVQRRKYSVKVIILCFLNVHQFLCDGMHYTIPVVIRQSQKTQP